MARGRSVGGRGRWVTGGAGCALDKGGGDADTGWISDGLLSSSGRDTLLQEAFVLRCVSSRVNRFPHLGHGSFLALPLALLAKVP